MKFGQAIEYNKRNSFFQNHAENRTDKLVPDFFLFFKKPSYEVKASSLELSFNTFRLSSTWDSLKTNCTKL